MRLSQKHMHIFKILSCALLTIAFPTVCYASDEAPIVPDIKTMPKEVAEKPGVVILPVSNQAKDLQPEVPLELSAETVAQTEQQQPSPVSNPTKNLQREAPLSPLQEQPTKLHNLETANQLRKGAVQGEAGFLQVLPTDSSVSGTGLQTYQVDIDWGVTDNLQIGFTGDIFDDYAKCKTKGNCGDLTTVSYGTKLKYRLINEERWAVGVMGTAQLLNLTAASGIFDNPAPNSSKKNLFVVRPVGALQFPATYKASRNLQLHLTPGVVFFPETIKGADFFGTFFNIGTGFSWQSSERLNLFGNIQVPLGPGGNTFNSKDRSISRQLLWTVGVDYAVNPRMGAEVYATNSYGTTPTTGLLAFLPDGDELQVGIRFKHVIDFGQGYAANFDNRPQAPLSYRDQTLLFDGFTLASAKTLPTGKFQVRGGLGTHGSSSFALAYGLTNDAQLELIVDQFGASDRIPAKDVSGPGVKIGGVMKLRFLDQARGDLLSLGFKLAGISETTFKGQSLTGSLYTEIPISYQLSPQTAISINPKGGFFGKVSRIGVGIGINQALSDKLQLIGEYTPILNDGKDVWSTGLRFLPNAGLAFDVFASNAIGQGGLGTVTAEPDTNFGFSINWGI
ncbi:porin [Anabaena sp. PCC 7108]|uniref:porin n=1 Tax=Anabaena sp. PCC 7108 TaxID=163908 RepID=UPI001ED9AF0E|nr:porin [Anabaena sp. PCC 7108]